MYIRANAGASDMGTINSSDRIAATLYSLGTWFVSGIYVYIPCIKEVVMMMMIIIIIRLKSGDIKGKRESTIVAAPDQAISTNYFKNIILKEERGSKCRLYGQHDATIDHLTSGCSIRAKNEYLMRR
jgi:hypothetical protein